MPDWKHLQKLNGGEDIWYSDPQLSLKGEVWLYSAGGELRVWSDGTLHKPEPGALKLTTPVKERFTLFTAIAMLKELHERFPRAHFVAEQLDLKKEPERMDSLDQQLSIFKRAYKHRIGTWNGGEHAVVPFDESLQALPKKTPPARIQPFGSWLHKHVSRLTSIAEENLREGL